VKFQATVPYQDATVNAQVCKGCHAEVVKGLIPFFSVQNNMDLLHAPSVQAGIDFAALPILCEIKQMLIARLVPIMKIYRLRSAYYGSKEMWLMFYKTSVNLCMNIRALQSLPVVLVHRKSGHALDEFVDLKVRPPYLQQWLVFLKHTIKRTIAISPFQRITFDLYLSPPLKSCNVMP